MSYHGHMRDMGRRIMSFVDTGIEPTVSYVPDYLTRCRVSRVDSKEVIDGSQMTPTDVEIRLPLSQNVTATDRFQVTHDRGKRLPEPELYAIVGEPFTALGERVLNCKRISAGSAR